MSDVGSVGQAAELVQATAQTLGVEQAAKLLLLGGILGLFGQGARAAVGLKTLGDYASGPKPSQADVFNAARFAISLGIGFLSGIGAGLTYFLAGGDAAKLTGETLLGFAAAGYVGTDAIEAFFIRYFDKGSGAALAAPPATGVSMADFATSVDAFSAAQTKLAGLSTAAPAAKPTLKTSDLMTFIATKLYPPLNPDAFDPTAKLPAGSPSDVYYVISLIIEFFASLGVTCSLQDFEAIPVTTYQSLANFLGALFVSKGGKLVRG
jgi:hypothetical protein